MIINLIWTNWNQFKPIYLDQFDQVSSNLNQFDVIWSSFVNLIQFIPIWSSLIKFQVWSSLIKFDPIYSNFIKFEPTRSNLTQFSQIWSSFINLSQLKQLWSNLIKFDPIRSRLIQFTPILSSLNQFESSKSDNEYLSLKPNHCREWRFELRLKLSCNLSFKIGNSKRRSPITLNHLIHYKATNL